MPLLPKQFPPHVQLSYYPSPFFPSKGGFSIASPLSQMDPKGC